MGQEPDVIRAEIERTRAGMTETVDALGYKADVKSRAKENVQERVESMKERISGIAGTVTDTASDAASSLSGTASDAAGALSDRTPDGRQVRQSGRRVVSVAQANPLGLAIGAASVGFIVGMLVPETRKEHEVFGEAADQLKDQVRSTASEAVDRGKEVALEAGQAAKGAALEAGQAAKETTQQAAQEHGQALKQSAQESAQQLRNS